MDLYFIDLSKPVRNALRSYYGRMRDECSNEGILYSLKEVEISIEPWRTGYMMYPPARLGPSPVLQPGVR